MVRRIRLLIPFIALIAVACGSQPSAPSATSFAGSWVGTLDGATLHMTLEQSGDTLTGSWVVSSGGNDGAGTASGRVDGSSMTVVLSWSAPTTNCPFTVSGTLDAAGTRMSGGVGAFACGGVTTGLTAFSGGGFSATRQ